MAFFISIFGPFINSTKLEGINIGLDTSFLSHLVVNDLKDVLIEMDIQYEIKDLHPCNQALLAAETVDLVILPLKELSISSEEDPWVISGFLKRRPSNYNCYLNDIHPGVFGVKPNAKIAFSDATIQNQIEELRPDLNLIKLDHSLALSQLISQEIDGYITNLDIQDDTLRKVPVATSDIVPTTSSGIYALVSNRLNIKARKISQLIHHDETGYLSNVERTISKELADHFNVHCSQDRAGNYHLSISNNIKSIKPQRVQISQSTFLGLADRALKELQI